MLMIKLIVFYTMFSYQITTGFDAQSTPVMMFDNIKLERDSDNVKMAFVGDVMVHGPQLKAQYDKSTGKYDFSNNFKYIKKYIEAADIAVLNFETTVAGIDKGGYTSFPRFNSPDELVYALKDVGFDIACVCNNHTLDRKAYGLNRTLDVLRQNDITYTGAKKDEKDNNYMIIEKKNIKIGVAAYTYEKDVNGKDTLNGNVIPENEKALINTFDYDYIDEELIKMKEVIDNMKKDGAEFIIFELHWGNEYQEEPNAYQQKIANFLCENGVNVIVGSHPHILQKFDTIEVGNKKTYVFYSIGNFISNQRYEILKQRKSENGIIIELDISKNILGEVNVSKVNYIPTWVNKYVENGKTNYEILPLNENLTEFKLSYKDNLWRAQNALKMIQEVIEKGSMKISIKNAIVPSI
ncbi:MAG TPA: hypothetical protein DEP72_06080 [Clostridiales bacterium]|nr:MAG: hypothetical protein A2Y18_01495 [Clostridiales bacterium GWD2_32_19]HCC07707.1 hypothetical protein [Clostridiales bacterium]